MGFNVGVLFWAIDDLKFGASYRSGIDHSLDGDIILSGTPGGIMDITENGKADMEIPASFSVGTAHIQRDL